MRSTAEVKTASSASAGSFTTTESSSPPVRLLERYTALETPIPSPICSWDDGGDRLAQRGGHPGRVDLGDRRPESSARPWSHTPLTCDDPPLPRREV